MLSEQLVQDAFHGYLKSSLTQAKLERLLDADMLSSAEGDLMITGPALCLYFAALRSTTNPPSVPLPRSVKSSSSSGSQPLDLSYDNCPPAFVPFLRVWAKTVPSIQSLAPEYQHDLARTICGLPPLTDPPNQNLQSIAAELRAVALEISQRRSFQNRYASDLQAALDSGGGSAIRPKASFVPPPIYEPTSSPASSTTTLPPPSPQYVHHDLPRHSGSTLSPAIPVSPSSSSHYPSRTPSPTILTPASPAIEFIRETLYAALGDVLEEHESLRTLLKSDPSRAYFASVSFAILSVATNAIDRSTKSVIGVLGAPLTLDQCPTPLRPFMTELIGIGDEVREMMEGDDRIAMECIQRGENVPSETRMDRVRKVILEGVEYENRRVEEFGGRRSMEGRAVGFANRIGGLALGMTRLSAFQERQDMVFKVLLGIGY